MVLTLSRGRLAVPIIAILVCGLFILSRPASPNVTAPSDPPLSASSEGVLHAVPPPGATRIALDSGAHFILQLPPGGSAAVRAVTLFFHGCRHAAVEHFAACETCSECRALPQEGTMTALALARGHAALAVEPVSGGCFGTSAASPPVGEDYDRVSDALRLAVEKHGIPAKAPVFAAGVSAGGKFATSLMPPLFALCGVHSVVAAPVPAMLESRVAFSSAHMGVRDAATASQIDGAAAVFRDKGVPVFTAVVSPKPVTAEYLRGAARSANWAEGVAEAVVSALRDGGHIDGDGMLTGDPRKSRWANAVKGVESKFGVSLGKSNSALTQELFRAWAKHEATAEHFDRALDLFDSLIANRRCARMYESA